MLNLDAGVGCFGRFLVFHGVTCTSLGNYERMLEFEPFPASIGNFLWKLRGGLVFIDSCITQLKDLLGPVTRVKKNALHGGAHATAETSRTPYLHQFPTNYCRTALEATQGQNDSFFSQLPYTCHQNLVASVGD